MKTISEKDTMTATPRPWKVKVRATQVGVSSVLIVGATNNILADVAAHTHNGMTPETGKANAALIVKAVNDHEVNEKARITLENLTPSGSEYHKDPERCAAYIQRLKHDYVEARKEYVRLRNTHDRVKAAIKAVLHEYDKASMFDANGSKFDELRAVLADMEG